MNAAQQGSSLRHSSLSAAAPSVLEPLERRRLLSAAPTIGSLEVSPDAVVRGQPFTVTAAGVADSDGTVRAVEFHADLNNSGAIDRGDLRLGRDASGADGFAVTYANRSRRLTGGTHTVLARATDDARDVSAVASATLTVANQPPTISALTVKPRVIKPGAAVTIRARAKDPDGVIARVDFYRDANGNGAADPGTDALIGSDDSKQGGWGLRLPGASVGTGALTLVAVATDNAGATSSSAAAPVTIPQAGIDLTVDTVTYDPRLFIHPVFVTGMLRNLGTVASGPFTVSIYISTDNVLDGGDILLTSLRHPGLKAGGARREEGVLDPEEIPHPQFGEFHFIVAVDADGQVSETNEQNNAFISPTNNFHMS